MARIVRRNPKMSAAAVFLLFTALVAGALAFYVPPGEARADTLTDQVIAVAADTCVQTAGTAVARNSDGVSSSSSFTLRCALDFQDDTAGGDGGGRVDFLQGYGKGCWDEEFGTGSLNFRVRKRALSSDSTPSNVTYCILPHQNGAIGCSESPNPGHQVDDAANYYYLEIQYYSSGAVCEVAGAAVTYAWVDDT